MLHVAGLGNGHTNRHTHKHTNSSCMPPSHPLQKGSSLIRSLVLNLSLAHAPCFSMRRKLIKSMDF